MNRAALLAVVASSLSVAVGLGIWASSIIWPGVLTVAAIATAATLLCNALEVGPPGAYQFALVCAVGTGLYQQNENPVSVALIVLAGGAFAWLVHVAGTVTLLKSASWENRWGEHRNAVVQRSPLPGRDHQPLRVGVLPVPAQLP
ncbi:hypothetical protein [Rhodococcus globerulus]|uniref:hypothetical protein n=1 Tax=Rhodococcus globerulus TaxID=33008 RepID=UPI0030178394